jgi:hypothetical protein
MSVNFNNVLLLFLLMPVFTVAAKDMVCDVDSNICTISSVENFCESGEISKVKWDIRSRQYIFSCECDCTSQENKIWLVDGFGNSPVRLVEASKIESSVGLSKNKSGVADIFGLVPYCRVSEIKEDKLVILQKVPSENGSRNPYCYDIADELPSEVCFTSECTNKLSLAKKIAKATKVQSLIEFRDATARIYSDKFRFQNFPKRDFLDVYISEYGYSKSDQQVYNDIAYYWQQAGFVEDSIWLLKQVISNNPDRVVAYLNMADSYWSVGEKAKASENYKKYSVLMINLGKRDKIPGRVVERIDF